MGRPAAASASVIDNRRTLVPVNRIMRAALLLNLGSPDSTSVADVRKYLAEFLLDRRVIDYPEPMRSLLVRGIILNTRPKKSAEAYRSIWTEQGSPLIVISKRQQELVQAEVELPVFLAMRYGEPSIARIVGEIAQRGVTELFILPLYPQYAMSSWETVHVKVVEELKRQAPHIRHGALQPFYNDPAYIDALVTSARPWLEKPHDLLLFSYHGIPKRQLLRHDSSKSHCQIEPNCCDACHPVQSVCYKHQCHATTKAFLARAGIPPEKSFTSFQSRLGREEWLRPYTDHTLERLAKEGVKRLLVMCPAFVTDCLETLEEIAEEGKESFLEHGGESFELIPCLNEHPAWIRWLAERIRSWEGAVA